ncbi:putative malate dehydrogenase [Obba rivulosa]|uniref:Putative malate dehydrogenase n=1 Tax=Obba rivulosa TaxID=1052685 RepID=A0A8E2DHE9_9APHY|nr:putative malate dehydrogenase [Obba rivulosa]
MFAILPLALLTSFALATPSIKRVDECDVSSLIIPLPSGQTTLVAPTNFTPTFIGVGVGVQNYTCGTTGTYTNVGALAEIVDISCFSESLFDDVTDVIFDAWEAAPTSITAAELINTLAIFDPPFVLGQHYFITNPITGSGLSPKWDFTSASLKGHPDAFAVGAKVGDLPAPTDSATNIDWLQLNVVQGDLANVIFRIQTRGGQPPTSCTPGSPEIFIRYAAQYWLYGGSF